MYAAGATWGGVVMTPPDQAQLVAHGRRGSDNFKEIPSAWFEFCKEDLIVDAPHLYNPYLMGDLIWSYDIYVNNNPTLGAWAMRCG